jgi:multidrug efflux pump subunit AcrA (membrane-fusion protein)
LGGQVEVKSGVKEGEQVVTEGSFTLKSELLKGKGEAHGP